MEVSIIFKIAAVGILVSVLSPGAEAQRPGGTGISGQPGRAAGGAFLDRAIYL